MKKSTQVALSLGLIAVLSCLVPVVHGKSVPDLCCQLRLSCCSGSLKARSIFARVKSKEQAMPVKSTLLRNLHDARAGGPEVEHPGVRLIEESPSKA